MHPGVEIEIKNNIYIKNSYYVFTLEIPIITY